MTFDVSGTQAAPSDAAFDAIKLTENQVNLGFVSGRGPLTQRGIVRTSRSGSVLSSTPLAPRTTSSAVFDDSGNAFSLRVLENRTIELDRYGTVGGTITFPLLAPLRAMNLVKNTLVTLGQDGTLAPIIGQSTGFLRSVRIQKLPDTFLLVGINDHTVVIVDQHSPLLRIADLSKSSVASVNIDTPEVRSSIARLNAIREKAPGQALSPLLFYDCAGDGRGHLFLALAPGQLASGMLLLEIDGDDNYKQSLQLLPPALARLKRDGNADGWVLQRRFSIDGSSVATTSSDGVVSLFELN